MPVNPRSILEPWSSWCILTAVWGADVWCCAPFWRLADLELHTAFRIVAVPTTTWMHIPRLDGTAFRWSLDLVTASMG
jgi:hypothetical protein